MNYSPGCGVHSLHYCTRYIGCQLKKYYALHNSLHQGKGLQMMAMVDDHAVHYSTGGGGTIGFLICNPGAPEEIILLKTT